MSVNLSAITVSSLSSSFLPKSFDFVNSDRSINYVELSSSLSGLNISYPLFTENIKNIFSDSNYQLFLTDNSELSSYFNTLKTISSETYGYDMSQINIEYDWILNDFSTTKQQNNKTQFLGILDSDVRLNLVPLKTKYSTNNDQYSINDNLRNYQKIYSIGDSLFLQFKTKKLPFSVNPDEYNLIFNSYNVVSCSIQNTDFIKNGAIGGNCPLNSDVIFFDQNEYGSYTNNGPNNINNINNGTLLCLWLSSQTPNPSSNKVWAERWYDPNTVTQGSAFITQKNSVSSTFSYIKDIISDKILSDKEKITYLRYGPKRNETFLKSISSNLVAEFNKWNKNFQSQVNGISGYIIGDYSFETNELVLHGTNHAHIPSVPELFIDNELSLSLWAYSEDWTVNNDSQFFGNCNNNTGYGMFYNTGTPDNLLSIPTSSDNLFSLNNKGFKVFEKDIKQDLGLSSININYIKTDLFGNRWLSDDANKTIYKLENDDILIKTIKLPSSSSICKIDCNSNNDIFILDCYNNSISSFDTTGQYISSINVQDKTKTFCIKNDDSIISGFSDFLDTNSANDIISIKGGTVFKNEEKILHLPSKPTCFRLDLQDNMWFLLNNTLYKTNDQGFLIFKKNLSLPFLNTDSEMCFVKTYLNNSEKINLWIVFNKEKRIMILDEDANLVKNLDLTKMFIGNSCSTFGTTVHGDFSGFDNKRKFELLNGKSISPSNSSITLRINLKCSTRKRIIQIHNSTKNLKSWCNFSFTLKNTKDKTFIKIYINGLLTDSVVLDGVYSIDYGYKTSPFIIAGNSGKLGAKNLEKSIVKNGYFKGYIDDIRLYGSCLNDFEIYNLSLNEHFNLWKPVDIFVDCPETTFLEEINHLYINRYKGFKSNYFNIKIKNFSNDINLQSLVKDYIKNNIQDYIPSNTILKDIIFE